MEHTQGDGVYRGSIAKLLARLSAEDGFDLSQYRLPYVERRISARLRTLNLHTYRQYARYLDEHPGEYAQLVDTLTINVTDFFRDAPVYDYFRQQVIPDLLARKLRGRQRMLRVWSAGCATGEEPYSLAMCFLDAMEQHGSHFMLSVFGTDVDPQALRTAKAAMYPAEDAKHIPPKDRRWIEIQGDRMHLLPDLTKCVHFRQLDLFRDPPLKQVDVIFCRNVFIYFNRDQQVKVLGSFHSGLSRGGYLVLGRSEKLAAGAGSLFHIVNGRERVYMREGLAEEQAGGRARRLP